MTRNQRAPAGAYRSRTVRRQVLPVARLALFAIALGASLLGSATPAHSVELADTPPGHDDAFRSKQRPLEHLTSAVSADSAAGRNHAMARHVGPSAVPHDVANRTPGARPPGKQRDVAVGGDAAGWDAADDREHACAEIVRVSFHVK